MTHKFGIIIRLSSNQTHKLLIGFNVYDGGTFMKMLRDLQEMGYDLDNIISITRTES